MPSWWQRERLHGWERRQGMADIKCPLEKRTASTEPGGTLSCGLTHVNIVTSSFRQFLGEGCIWVWVCIGASVCLGACLCSSQSICLKHLACPARNPPAFLSTWEHHGWASKAWYLPACQAELLLPSCAGPLYDLALDSRLRRVVCVLSLCLNWGQELKPQFFLDCLSDKYVHRALRLRLIPLYNENH